MKPSVIYLDMDGVLVDLVRHTYRLFDMPTAEVDQRHSDTKTWDGISIQIADALGVDFADQDLQGLWEDAGQEFWATVPWRDGGHELLDVCRASAPVMLLSTPTGAPSCVAGKLEWIQRETPALARTYSLSPAKHMVAHPGALLIDDGEHNVEAFKKAGGMTFLWPAPWNSKSNVSVDEALADLAARLASGDFT